MATSYTNSIGTVTLTETTLNYAPNREALMIAAQAAAEHLPVGKGREFKNGRHVFLAHRTAEDRILALILQPYGADHAIRANAVAWSVETIGTEEGDAAEEILNTMSPEGLGIFHDNYCPDCR